MKLFLILLVLLAHQINFAQELLLEENFDYPAGNFIDGTNWIPDGTVYAQIIDNNLSYTNYPSSGQYKLLSISAAYTSDYRRVIPTCSTLTVYYSFLIDILGEDNIGNSLSSADYFIHFRDGGSGISLLYIRKGSSSLTFKLGLGKNTNSTPTFTLEEYDYNSTYLIIISYTFNSGSSTDDITKLWVNPSLSGSEPEPTLTFTDAQSDASKIDRVSIRQGTRTPNAYIDGIRVATTWNQAPLPVELTSFTGAYINNAVHLKWQTATEINNYGFEIQRSEVRDQKSEVGDQKSDVKNENQNNISSGDEEWEVIGFVQGNGNSNSAHNYSYIDNQVQSGNKYNYRLKQIDTDGSYSYSNVVEVGIPPGNKFYLFQNYPNPFNSQTKITWYQPETGEVIIRIYDTRGSLVKDLNIGNKTAGINETSIDADDITSGCYFLVLKANNVIQTKKIILIK